MTRIAVTGNIASGKSAAAKILEKRGFTVYDTDIMAHQILENSPEIKQLFRTTNRKEIAKIVFKDSEKMELLESIIHPIVKEEILKINNGVILIPQLFEAGFETMFDKIIFVSAPENIRLARLMKRNGLTEEEARLRIQAQLPEEEKIPKCDFVIKNDSTIENLEEQIEKLLVLIR